MIHHLQLFVILLKLLSRYLIQNYTSITEKFDINDPDIDSNVCIETLTVDSDRVVPDISIPNAATVSML